MPGRKTLLVNNEVYHVFNKGITSQLTFLTKRNYSRALETIFYYQNTKPLLKFSKFLKLSTTERAKILEELKNKRQLLIEIIAYCLMGNHFHLILKQTVDNGISKFLGDFTNSYTRYFNVKEKRSGPLFQGKFKAVRVETDEQLLHLSRYIHLNPYASYIVRTLKELEDYPYSSFHEYLGKTKIDFCQKEIILGQFKDVLSYKKFVLDQANDQRKLEEIKHLMLEV